jgi:hypothetical protein
MLHIEEFQYFFLEQHDKNKHFIFHFSLKPADVNVDVFLSYSHFVLKTSW